MSMTKQELIKTIANSAAITLKEAEQAVNTLVDLLVDEVKTEGRFALAGVGVFTQVTRAAKERPEPQDRRPHPDPREEVREVPPRRQLQGDAERVGTRPYPLGLGGIVQPEASICFPGGCLRAGCRAKKKSILALWSYRISILRTQTFLLTISNTYIVFFEIPI